MFKEHNFVRNNYLKATVIIQSYIKKKISFDVFLLRSNSIKVKN